MVAIFQSPNVLMRRVIRADCMKVRYLRVLLELISKFMLSFVVPTTFIIPSAVLSDHLQLYILALMDSSLLKGSHFE